MKLITIKNYQNRTMMCIDEEEDIGHCQPLQGSLKNTSMQMLENEESRANKQGEDLSFTENFDQFKNYENFMKKHNISNIIPKYE